MDLRQEVLNLKQRVAELRELDPELRLYGSSARGGRGHQYQFQPPLSAADAAEFEAKHGVQLPEDYRLFLTTVGNGGAGPHLGLLPLDCEVGTLARPFPLTEKTEGFAPGSELEAYFEDDDYDDTPGCLSLADAGCGNCSHLVVNGPTAGQVWEYAWLNNFCPTGVRFLDWYHVWAENGIALLRNEPLQSQLRPGMTTDDLYALADIDWRERPIDQQSADRFPPNVRILTSPQTSFSVSVDEQDKIVEVTPGLLFATPVGLWSD